MSNKVSVVVPVKNCASTIERSVSSVLKQTYKNFELIIIDNNCTDDTIEKVKSFEDDRIKIFSCKVPGIVPALNTGLQKSSGEYIARQDGDDYWYPEKLQKQIHILENSSADICGTQINIVDKDFKLVDNSFRYPLKDKPIKSWLLTGKNAIAHPSVVFRKDVLLRVGGYDDSYPIAEDHHMWLRCIRWFNFFNLPEVLVDYTAIHNPRYDPRYPLLSSEAQFKLLKHMGYVKV
tara:strand:- start:2013 stop:2714 length:702 start_codon:yes stop_codon:yes gene_type:complete